MSSPIQPLTQPLTHPLTHHVDLVIRPDAEFTLPQLMNALYAKLHRALHDLAGPEGSRIGVSFPRQRRPEAPLGEVLRLHGREADLHALMAAPWLAGMRDHLHPWVLRPIPTDCREACVVRRVDVEANPLKLRRRWLRRHPDATPAQAAAHYPDRPSGPSGFPYLSLHSRSNGQPYRLHVHQQRQPMPAEVAFPPKFSTFGLAQGPSDVPWF